MQPRARTTTGTYRALAMVNWSSLKRMIKGRDAEKRLVLSPLQYKAALDGVDVDTESKRLGRAVHCATLEPETFESRFIAYRESKSKGEGARKAWEAFQAANTTRTILDGEGYDRALAISRAVRAHPEAARLLSQGEAEAVRTWTDKETGILCKARLDWIHAASVFADLKTDGKTIEEHAFNATAERWGYFGQMAYYRRALASDGNRELASIQAWVIAVESAYPHEVAVREVDPDSLYAADEEIDLMLATLKRCRESDEWPGAYPAAGVLKRPAWTWAIEDATDDLMIGGE